MEYPIISLKEREKTIVLQSQASKQSIRSLSIRKPKHLQILLREIWEQTKALCQQPHLKNTAITCAIQFGLTTSYYTLMVWFPELFYRFEEYEAKHANEDTSVCIVSKMGIIIEDNDFCGEPINDEVFWHTVIIGLSCIPTSFLLPLCIHRLGAKFFIGK
jgi:VNT family MFS transporter (synaptic vesicle glycoprotein 2)